MRPVPIMQETIWPGMYTRPCSSWPQLYPPNYFWHRLILKSIYIPPDSCSPEAWRPRNILASHPQTRIFVTDSSAWTIAGIMSMLGHVSKLQHGSTSLCPVFHWVCLKICWLPRWGDVCCALDGHSALSVLYDCHLCFNHLLPQQASMLLQLGLAASVCPSLLMPVL